MVDKYYSNPQIFTHKKASNQSILLFSCHSDSILSTFEMRMHLKMHKLHDRLNYKTGKEAMVGKKVFKRDNTEFTKNRRAKKDE